MKSLGIKAIGSQLDRIATGRRTMVAVVVSTALLIPYFGLVFRDQLAQNPLIDQTFNFSPQDVHKILETYGARGRVEYFRGELIDFILIPIVAVAMACVVNYGFKRLSRGTNMALVPLLAGLLNALKVMCILPLILLYPNEPVILSYLANYVNILKIFAIISSLILMIAAIGVILIKLKKSRLDER
jgi:hypothetical protein